MRFNGYIFIFIIIIASCTEESNTELSPDDIYFDDGYDKNENKNLPQIFFEEPEFNFGIILEGEKIKHTFSFINKGKSNLLISQVTPECGCTTTKDFSREPIAPNGTGQIEIEFDSTSKIGAIRKSISVVTNGSPNKTAVLVSGEVIDTKKIIDLNLE